MREVADEEVPADNVRGSLSDLCTNAFEMGSTSIHDVVSRMAADEGYQRQFLQAFGRVVNEQDMRNRYLRRTLVSFDSLFHRFIAGDENAIRPARLGVIQRKGSL